MKKKIGILEDRRSFASDLHLIVGMENPECDVFVFHGVDEAIDAVRKDKEWLVWIVDLMMAKGEEMSLAETDNGLSTGVRFIERLSSLRVMVEDSVVVYTSRSTDTDKFPIEKFEILDRQKAHVTQVAVAKEISERVKGKV